MSSTRRKAIQTMAGATMSGASIAAPLAAQHRPQHRHESSAFVQISTPAKPKFFTPPQMETLAALVDVVIPRTDTPGAYDVGVHRIIDNIVSRAKTLQKPWLEGLAWAEEEARSAGTETFSKLAVSKQIAILERAEKSRSTFFSLLKGSTIDAYYSTREGLVTELGWNANSYLPEFKGCTHPEHQG